MDNLKIDTQELVNRYARKGALRVYKSGKWTNKEFVKGKSPIGYCVDEKTKEKVLTNKFSISYSKEKGVHIVSRR